MKIHVKKAQQDAYALTFDDVVHTLTVHELKTLLLEAVKALSPGALPPQSPQENARELGARLETANGAGLQKLILAADDDTLAVFLKGTADNQALHELMFANMSERKHQMLAEDLEFRFAEGVEDTALDDAVIKLTDLANHLQTDGILVLGGAAG